MKKLLFIPMILLNFIANGQNLVPNPSFEDTISCPGFPQPTINYCLGWSSFRGTPDYFNPCANSGPSIWGVPLNVAGNQNSFLGSSYSGLLTWFISAGSPIREYMGAQLLQPLTIGTKYFVSCFISNGDSISSNSSTNNFGFKFSTMVITDLINNFSHVHSDSIINDKVNWSRISGSFVADSIYHYLLIGNFYDDINTMVDTMPPFGLTGAYYYVDAVCVTSDSLYDVNWVGINEENKRKIIIYPNPADQTLNIENIIETRFIDMFDLQGRNVRHQKLVPGKNKISTSLLAAGMYLIYFDSIYQKKIIVQH